MEESEKPTIAQMINQAKKKVEEIELDIKKEQETIDQLQELIDAIA